MNKLYLALPLLLAACSNSIPFEELALESASLSCELVFECCEAGQRHGFADEAACVTSRRAEVVPEQLAASVAAGRIAYDGTAASECLGMAMCDLDGLDVDVCTSVYTGLVEAGGACTFGLDCVEGTGCEDDVCVAPPGLGEACIGSCAEGTYCNVMAGVCEALPNVGDACPGFRCGADAFCETSAMICESRRASGETCANAGECESFQCEGGVCTARATGICGTP